ncbi:hypothetical protein [Dactylosporangium sp. NPDC000521]|uniref:hypothetical protein n=1 Tax=Dactylosporangium sp. NPDC000521 TaxID=3363975 RepID=UPI0036A4F02F
MALAAVRIAEPRPALTVWQVAGQQRLKVVVNTVSDRETPIITLRERLAEIAASPMAGASLATAADDLRAEDIRFNRWVYGRKGSAGTVAMWNLAALAEKHHEQVETAWNTFRAAATDEVRDAQQTEFEALLRRVHAEQREIITTGVNTYRDPDMPEEINNWD